jgi:hypothetical protein
MAGPLAGKDGRFRVARRRIRISGGLMIRRLSKDFRKKLRTDIIALRD